MKLLALAIVLILLAGCAAPVDRCTADPNLPDCKQAAAQANATISAIDIQRAAMNREATRQAIESAAGAIARATQAAAGAEATQIAVSAFSTKTAAEANAQATKNALEIQAMNQTLMMSSTLAAINADTARVKSQIELSTTQLIGQAAVTQRQIEADTTLPRTALGLGLLAFVIVVIALSVSFAVRRGANAAANFAEVRSGLVTHGQHAWLVTPGPDGTKHVKRLTGMIGDYGASNALDNVLDQLDVPDQDKLRALIEFNRQRAAVDISANIHAWPDVEQPIEPGVEQIAAGPTLNARYQIVASNEHLPLLTSVPQAVEVLDAEWRRLEMTA